MGQRDFSGPRLCLHSPTALFGFIQQEDMISLPPATQGREQYFPEHPSITFLAPEPCASDIEARQAGERVVQGQTPALDSV